MGYEYKSRASLQRKSKAHAYVAMNVANVLLLTLLPTVRDMEEPPHAVRFYTNKLTQVKTDRHLEHHRQAHGVVVHDLSAHV